MRRLTRARAGVALCASIVATIGVACADDRERAQAASTSGLSEQTAAELGGDAASSATEVQRLLTDAVRAFPDSRLDTARIGRPAPDLNQEQGVRWAYFTVRVARRQDYALGAWQARVATGVVRAESRRRKWPRIAGLTLSKLLPSGHNVHAITQALPIEVARPVQVSPDELARSLRAHARSNGWKHLDVDVVAPLGYPAVEARLTTSRLQPFLTDLSTAVRSVVGPANGWGRPAQAEGAYLEVYDLKGRLVVAAAYSVRTGHGISQFGRAYANRAKD